MGADQYKHNHLTEQIIKASYFVHHALGNGFLEKVYENALVLQLRRNGLQVPQQEPITVSFQEEPVGEFFADLLVEEKVIVELKAVEQLHTIHEVQLVNYLKATSIEIGLLLNFGRKVDVRRKILHHPCKSASISV